MASPFKDPIDSRMTVLITGCGLRVFATARTVEALSGLETLGIEGLSLEVTSPESVAEAKRIVSEKTRASLDILINNAGRNYNVPALDIDFDQVRSVFDTNTISVMRMCKEFSPLLIKAKGTIINIGSVAADIPYVFGSVYNASKAALHAYSDTLRVELAPFDVKVMVVVTGGVKSNIARTPRELPQDSLYLPLAAEYQRRQLHSQEGAMDTNVYAEGVVITALKTRPARSLWRGHQAWNIWLLLRTMPRHFWDYYFSRVFRFDKLVQSLKASNITE
ncbi:MAG: hypothetical protein Q9217_003854 [Psora testacea]